MFEIALVVGLLLVALVAFPMRRTPKFKPEIFIPEKQPDQIIDSAQIVRHLSTQAKGKHGNGS